MLQNDVKLVIWDLDDTFWSGTLAEGEITPLPENQDRHLHSIALGSAASPGRVVELSR